MKLTVILLTISLVNVFAEGFSQNITYTGEEVPLEEVFSTIKKQTGYGFFYNQELLKATKSVTIKVTNAPLSEVLDKVFKDQPLDYSIKNKTILVSKRVPPNRAPEGLQAPVTGKVIDDAGQPLPGVSIKVKSATQVASTDANGNFSIPAKIGDVLIFTYIGMESVEVNITTRSGLNVTMQKSQTSLNEVVVVGYGSVAKRDVTGSITSVTSKQIQERSPLNVFDALQGQAPGVQVSSEDGRAGAQASVIIRGIGTLGTGAGPLYIVDGAQNVNIDGINPLDIERIEILKDASSAAIYGARGANGVILITTKKGKEGEPQIAGTLLTTFGRIAHKIPLANAAERRLFESKISGSSGALSADSLTPGRNADNDAFAFVTRVAKRNDANLSLSGASKVMHYYAGLGYTGDESVIINQWAKQARFRLNLDFIPNSKFTMSNNLQFSLRNENLVNTRNVLHHGLARIPYYVYYFPDGSFAPTISGRRNPLANALLGKNLNKTYDTNIFNTIEYKFTKDFKFTTDATLRYSNKNQFQFTPRILNSSTSNPNGNNSGQEDIELRTEWLAQAYFNYNKNFNQYHTVTAMLGGSTESKNRKTSRISGSDFLTEEVLTMNSAQVTGVPTTAGFENAASSLFGRVGYNYKGRYQVNGTMRVDGSSRFGTNNRWGYFPSAAVGWTLSDESFMKWSSMYLNNAKLRASYGVVGNDQVLGDYDAIQQYQFGSQFYNGVSGVVLSSTYGNNLLSWETNKAMNLGMDLSFFRGKLDFVADYYVKTTTDLLYRSPMVQETGFSQVAVNLGSIQNKGFEFMITGNPIAKTNLNWTVTYNMAFNKGMVKELANHTPILSGKGSLTEEGQPLGNFYGWRQLRVFPYDQSNAFDPNMNPLTPVFNGSTFTGYTLNGQAYTGPIVKKQTNGLTAVGGDVDWEDRDKNGIIDDSDRSVLGNAQPDYTFGINNSVRYKALTLSFNIYGSMGGQIYNAALANQTQYIDEGDSPPPAWIYGAWFKQGDITDMPKAKVNSSIGNTREISSRYIEDASFIRLRNVKLAYEIPGSASSYIGARRISFYVQGNNLMTYSNYQHFDPEIAQSNPLLLGVDGQDGNPRIPRKNEVMFGLNITF